MGIGIATSSEMSFKTGRAEQGNFNTYEVTRITEAPREIRVHILPGDFDAAARRRGRARGAAGPARPLQRHLRGDGQAHPAPADPRPAEGLIQILGA